MNTGWAPKPLRPDAVNPLFEMVEAPTIVKGLTPMQRQRLADGTPHTVTPPSALRPADPALTLPDTMIKKGSLVAKYDERPKPTKQDPEDPMTVVKSYLAFKADPSPDDAPPVSKSVDVAKMTAAIQDVLEKTGAK